MASRASEGQGGGSAQGLNRMGAAPVGATLNTRTCHSCVSICSMTQPQNSLSSSTTKQWPVVFNQKGRDGGPDHAPCLPRCGPCARPQSRPRCDICPTTGPGLAPSRTRDAEAPEWFSLVAFGTIAEALAKHAKDDMVAIGPAHEVVMEEPGRRAAHGLLGARRFYPQAPARSGRRRRRRLDTSRRQSYRDKGPCKCWHFLCCC